MAQKKLPSLKVGDTKRWLRQLLIKRRQRNSSLEQKRMSRRICRHALSTREFRRSQTVAVYIGFGSEVLTDTLLQEAWRKGKQVLIPMTTKGFHQPFFVFFKKGDSLIRTRRGPLELAQPKKPFDFKKIDLVLVPGLAFDLFGHRLGYGGGVYDRILKKTPQAVHMGLFFSRQEIRRIPGEEHDQKMQVLVTERGVHSLAKFSR